MSSAIKLNDRELATVLAALRYWQVQGLMSASDYCHDIASNGGTLVPLSYEEIDQFCEAINR